MNWIQFLNLNLFFLEIAVAERRWGRRFGPTERWLAPGTRLQPAGLQDCVGRRAQLVQRPHQGGMFPVALGPEGSGPTGASAVVQFLLVAGRASLTLLLARVVSASLQPLLAASSSAYDCAYTYAYSYAYSYASAYEY